MIDGRAGRRVKGENPGAMGSGFCSLKFGSSFLWRGGLNCQRLHPSLLFRTCGNEAVGFSTVMSQVEYAHAQSASSVLFGRYVGSYFLILCRSSSKWNTGRNKHSNAGGNGEETLSGEFLHSVLWR
jgi:hypothetical protein